MSGGMGGGEEGIDPPTTTKGDISGFDTTFDRIPIGADSTVLTADSTEALGLAWKTAGGGATTTNTRIDLTGGNFTTTSTIWVDITNLTHTLSNVSGGSFSAHSNILWFNTLAGTNSKMRFMYNVTATSVYRKTITTGQDFDYDVCSIGTVGNTDGTVIKMQAEVSGGTVSIESQNDTMSILEVS